MTTARELGPPTRVRSYQWSDGLPVVALHAGPTAADYVGIAGAAPIGTAEDVAYALPGYLEGALSSGEVPVVLLSRLPTATGTIRDRDLFVYGRVTGSLSVGSDTGGEGTDQVLTLTGFGVTEIR